MTKKEWYFYIGAFVIGIGFLIYYNEVNVYVDQVLFLTLAFAPLFIFMFIYTLYVKLDSRVLIAPGIKATIKGKRLFDESTEETIEGREPCVCYALEGVDAHGISIPEGGGMGGYFLFLKKYELNFNGMIAANVHPKAYIGKNEHDLIDEDRIDRIRNDKYWKEDCCVYVGEFPYLVIGENGGVVKYSPTAKEKALETVLDQKNFTITKMKDDLLNANERNKTLIKQFDAALKAGMIEGKGIPSIFRKGEEIGGRRES